jgi:membrane protein implicated in regulation of membrane protease activity
MDTSRSTSSTTEIATEVSGLLAGLGILTTALFPFALPGLLLAAPLALVAVAGLLLAIPVVLPVWLVRVVRRRLARAKDLGSTPPQVTSRRAAEAPRQHA